MQKFIRQIVLVFRFLDCKFFEGISQFDAKTELLLIGTRQQLAKITIDGMMSLLHNLPLGICVCGWILAYQWMINNDLQHSIICTILGG